MPSLYLIRHGESQANVDGLLAGRTPGVALTDRGRTQASDLGEALGNVAFDLVVTSPLQRCVETCEAVFGTAGDVPVMEDDGLNEVDYGSWSARRLADLFKEPAWTTVQRQPSRMTFPDGENLGDMSRRVVGTVRALDAEVEREFGDRATWAAVTHGDVIKAIIADALGMHLDAFQRIAVAPASVSIIHYGAEGVTVQCTGMTPGRLPSPPGKSTVGGGNEAPAALPRDAQAQAGAQASGGRARFAASDGARFAATPPVSTNGAAPSHDAGGEKPSGRHASDAGGRHPRH